MRSALRRLLDCLMILALIWVWTAWLIPYFIKKIIKPKKHGGDDEKKLEGGDAIEE
ncbi:MAG: hypothetical protein HWN68_09635 [Desulfobacterales bacterium]|nr:hypothetical protein [Desulfobacterales bacterium]